VHAAPVADDRNMTRALVVDDAPMLRRAMVRMLVRRGLDVGEVGDGPAALATLAAGPVVAVVMIDCIMPSMNGVDVIARLRREPRYDAVKLVLVTGLEEGGATELARVAGADAVLLKPFREAELAAVLDRLGVPRQAA
jgi:CheY-like chemotaxis protein